MKKTLLLIVIPFGLSLSVAQGMNPPEETNNKNITYSIESAHTGKTSGYTIFKLDEKITTDESDILPRLCTFNSTNDMDTQALLESTKKVDNKFLLDQFEKYLEQEKTTPNLRFLRSSTHLFEAHKMFHLKVNNQIPNGMPNPFIIEYLRTIKE